MFKSQFSMCQMSSIHSGTHARPLSVFECQVWEDHRCWMLSWLWAGRVAPAGGLGPGPRRGGAIREAPAAGRCAPAHQRGARLPGQSPLLPLYDLRPHPGTRGSWPEGWEESLHNKGCYAGVRECSVFLYLRQQSLVHEPGQDQETPRFPGNRDGMGGCSWWPAASYCCHTMVWEVFQRDFRGLEYLHLFQLNWDIKNDVVFASKGQTRLFIPKLCRIIAGMSEELEELFVFKPKCCTSKSKESSWRRHGFLKLFEFI